jgi:hypothetical protein
MSTKIMVKPVPRESVQKRHLTPVRLWDPIKKQFVDTGQASGKTKATGAVDTYSFDSDLSKGVLITGLEEMIPNPYKDMDWLEVKMQQALSDKWDTLLPNMVKQEKISRQVYYEILDSVDPNFYTSKISQSMINIGQAYDPKIPKTFLEKFEVTFYDGGNVFTSDTQRGRFAIQLCRYKKLIAKNRDIANSNYHMFYIAEENEEEVDRIRIDRLENEAIAALSEMQNKYPPFKLYQFAIILRNENGAAVVTTTGDVSSQIVEDQLNRFIKNKDRYKAERIHKFLDAFKLFKGDSDRFLVEYMFSQALNHRVFTARDGYFFWNSKTETPTWYRWKTDNALKTFLLKEYGTYNKKDPSDSNAYHTLRTELMNKGVKFE